jgi:flagellar biosynthesis protein FlhB
MADEDKNQERTEQATPKRREEAREKGQVARSHEVASVAVLGACIIYLYFNAENIVHEMGLLMANDFRAAARVSLTPGTVQAFFWEYLYRLFFLIAPLLLTVVIAGLAANIVQVGIVFSSEPLQPKLSKIDPFKGMQRLFSLRSIVELLKGVLKIVIVGLAGWISIRGEISSFPRMIEQGAGGILLFLGKASFKILLATCLVLAVLAVLDYAFQRWEFEKSLKMSRQDIKEEFRQTEGDPLVKARIRRIQREMARRRMMAAVPKADVVITNPTHLAIALSYDQHEMAAPLVTAKGSGHVAEKIRELARAHHVPVVENKPVAQVLYKMVNLNCAIPEHLYRAVAEILAYIYQVKQGNRV